MDCYEHGGDVYGNPGIRLDFSVNTHPLGMPQRAREALLAQAEAFSRYPDPQCRALRQALARRHGVAPENILCGNGAADLIFRICACLRPRRALTLAPTFSEYRRAVELFGGSMAEHRLREEDGFALGEDVLAALLPGAEAFFLCNPNNPTGRLAPEALLPSIARACAQNGALLVVDECFLAFTRGASLAALCREFPNLLILNAFTKFYGLAGLRLGYLLGDGALLARIEAFGAPWSVSAAAQAAGLGALAEPGWEARTLALVEGDRAFLEAGVRALGLTVFPSDANFLLCKSPVPLHEPLKRRGILVRSCANFTGLDEGYLRIGIKTREQNAALLSAMGEALHG